jgi:uncharacterized repeat protein (TIGR01451 family)
MDLSLQPASISSAGTATLPGLLVEKRGPQIGRVGEVLEYEIKVRNAGRTKIDHVLLQDLIPAGAEIVETSPAGEGHEGIIQWPIEGMSPGDQRKFTVRLRAQHPGELRLKAVASIQFTRAAQTQILGLPLSLNVAGPSAPVPAGQIALFKITLVNKSSQPVKGLSIKTELPPGLKHPQGQSIEADMAPLAPGEAKVIDLGLTPEKPGRHVFEVTVSTPTGERLLGRAEVLAQPVLQLKIRKVGPAQLIKGRVAEYRLEVVNPVGAEARNVVIMDQLPEGLTLVAASNKGTFDAGTRSVQWLVGNLRPGEAYVVGLRLRGDVAGPVSNNVIAQAMGWVRAYLVATLLVEEPAEAGRQNAPVQAPNPKR